MGQRSTTPQMYRRCDITGKSANLSHNVVTFSEKKNRKPQHVNLVRKKFYWAEGDCMVRLKIAASTLRTIRKNGLNATAKKYGVDLKKYRIRGYAKQIAAMKKTPMPDVINLFPVKEPKVVEEEAAETDSPAAEGEPKEGGFFGLD